MTPIIFSLAIAFAFSVATVHAESFYDPTGSCVGSFGPNGLPTTNTDCAKFNGIKIDNGLQLGVNGEIMDSTNNPVQIIDPQGLLINSTDASVNAVNAFSSGLGGWGGWFSGFNGVKGIGTGTGTTTGVYGLGRFGIEGVGSSSGTGVLGKAGDQTATGGIFKDSANRNRAYMGTHDYALDSTGDVLFGSKMEVNGDVNFRDNVSLSNKSLSGARLPNLTLELSMVDKSLSDSMYSCVPEYRADEVLVRCPDISHTHSLSSSATASGSIDPGTHALSSVAVYGSTGSGTSTFTCPDITVRIVTGGYLCVKKQI